jgi:hypothetical protein
VVAWDVSIGRSDIVVSRMSEGEITLIYEERHVDRNVGCCEDGTGSGGEWCCYCAIVNSQLKDEKKKESNKRKLQDKPQPGNADT